MQNDACATEPGKTVVTHLTWPLAACTAEAKLVKHYKTPTFLLKRGREGEKKSGTNRQRDGESWWGLGVVTFMDPQSTSKIWYTNVPVNSKTAHPPPRVIPGHLTHVKLRTVGNLTQNEARPVGHLTFVSKRLSAVGSKMISQFFDSAGEPRSQVIALVDSMWVFLLLSFYIVLSWNMPLFKVWSEGKLNKKFAAAENFA